MQNIDELVNRVSKQINLDELITNCSKEFLNKLQKEIRLEKFYQDIENFLSIDLKNFDSEIYNDLCSFYLKHKEDFNSEEAQKYFMNIIKNSSIYETVKSNFLDYFRHFLQDNPTNEIRKRGFEQTLTETNIKIRIENFTFNSDDKYDKILNKLTDIVFKNCTFQKYSYYFLIHNKNCELKFEKCIFKNEWEYIESKSTLYSNCTFDIYKHYNIAEIKEVVEDLLFYNCTFKKIICEGIHFKKQIFKNNNLYEDLQFEELSFIRCEFDKKFLITYNKPEDSNTLFKIKQLDLTDSIFHSKVGMKEINFSRISIFNNTKFNELCDFYGSKFNNINCFTKTTFNDICVFTNVTFKNDVDFKYTTFGKLALFKEAIFEKRLNLEDAIIKEEINFLKIKNNNKELDSKNMANRETARIIKDSFEKQNNIIEANKFYALEMKEREKELEEEIKKGKNIFEWLVFKIHGLASNHSQDWLLPIFWILNISILIPFFKLVCFETLKIEMTIFIITYFYLLTYLVVFSDKYRAITIIISSFLIYMVFYKLSPSINLNSMSSNLNPFSIMIESNGAENKDLDFITLIFKSTVAYLIYQLIISIRQNTRRK